MDGRNKSGHDGFKDSHVLNLRFELLLKDGAAGLAEPRLVLPQARGDPPGIGNFTGAQAIDVRRASPALGRRAARHASLRVRWSYREQDAAQHNEADHDNRDKDADQDRYPGHGADLR